MSELLKLNDPVVLTTTFTVSGTLTDPTALTLVVTNPSGTATTYNWPTPADITHVSTGSFKMTVAGNAVGRWAYVWTGSGAAAGVQDGTFDIFAAEPVSPALYASLDELNAVIFSGGASSNTDDDPLKLMALEGASRWIDGYTDRPAGFGKDVVDTTRTFVPYDWYTCQVDDLVSITTLKTDSSGDGVYEATWTTNDYQLHPYNPVKYGVTWPYSSIQAVGTVTFPPPYFYPPMRANTVQITGRFGWPAIPAPVRNACLMLAHAAYERRKSPSGIIGGFPDLGAIRVGVRIDPDVERLLAPFRRLAVLIA